SGSDAIRNRLTGLFSVGVRDRHCVANNPPLGRTVGLVSSTRSPWIASISAGVSRAHAYTVPFETSVPFLALCVAAPPSRPAKTNATQGKILSVGRINIFDAVASWSP